MNQQAQAPQGGQQNIKVVFPDETSKQGKYSNAVSVHINGNEVVLDFGYTIPNTNPMEIMVVQRMNMNHRAAEQFLTVLQNSLLDFRNKVKEMQAQQQGKGGEAPAAPAA